MWRPLDVLVNEAYFHDMRYLPRADAGTWCRGCLRNQVGNPSSNSLMHVTSFESARNGPKNFVMCISLATISRLHSNHLSPALDEPEKHDLRPQAQSRLICRLFAAGPPCIIGQVVRFVCLFEGSQGRPDRCEIAPVLGVNSPRTSALQHFLLLYPKFRLR